jgi:hypothetical protein
MILRNTLAALALAVGLWTPALAAPDAEETAILAQVNRLFAAMKAQDKATLDALMYADGMMTVLTPKGVRRAPFSSWSAGIVARTGIEETIWDAKVLRRGDMAVVWAPFELKVDGKVSHCGIDAIDMVKADGAWKVAGLMYTHEPDACGELRRVQR